MPPLGDLAVLDLLDAHAICEPQSRSLLSLMHPHRLMQPRQMHMLGRPAVAVARACRDGGRCDRGDRGGGRAGRKAATSSTPEDAKDEDKSKTE